MTDYTLGATIYHKFTSRRFSTGAPYTLAGTPAVQVYEDGSTTQITSGITLTADFDSVTGLNHVEIVATSGNGFESGKDYAAVISAGTVDSVSVVGEVLFNFSIEKSAPIARLPAALVGGRMDVSVGAMASGTMTASALATDAVNEIADGLLDRDMSTGTDSGSTTVRTPRQALRALRNRVTAAGTVYKEDDSTASWTFTPTTDAAAEPIIEINPAGP